MFSLPFKLRRKSDIEHHSTSRRGSANMDLAAPLAGMASAQSASSGRTRSHSHSGRALSRTFSNSLSKRLSFLSNHDSSGELNSLDSQMSDFASQELTRFKTLNHDRFPKEVLQYLKFQGLSAPSIVQESTLTRISVAASGENIFLPSLVSITEEEQQNLELNSPNPTSNLSRPATETASQNGSTTTTSNSDSTSTVEAHAAHAPIQTHMDDSVDPISHTFAVIVTLQNDTTISSIKAQLQAICSIDWPKGLPIDRNIRRERFELGQVNWDLSLTNYNYFVPLSEEAIDDEDEWDYDQIDASLDESRFLTEQKIPSKKVGLRSFDQVTRGGYANYKKDQDPFVLGALGNSSSATYSAGHYVFLLPTLFEPSLPESVLTTKAHVSYSLRTIVVPKSKTYQYGEHYVRVIRGPPVSGITTADKPIFVSKVWNETLSYEISFPKKYVTLGSEVPFKMKLVPLEKKVAVKRVKVNVVEKITYVSKNLEYEYDEHGDNDSNIYLQAHDNEKIIPLLEVRAKPRASKAAREECIEAAGSTDNLLSCCYKAEPDSANSADSADSAEIVGPLSISTYLSFIKPQKSPKTFPHCQKQYFQSVVHTEKKPQVSRDLRTRISNQNSNVNTTTRVNAIEEGLLPDSLNNRYVNIDHKLQICVRVSRTTPDDGKVHHYEVIIDTPVFLLNGSCVPESVELPAYTDYHMSDSERLPTFEEVLMSPMSSPVLMPYHEITLDSISRTSTLASAALDLVYDNIDSLVNDTSQLSLSLSRRRSTSAKAEMVDTFRRTLSRTAKAPPSDASSISSSSASIGALSRDIPDAPPSYVESVALMSDESDEESVAPLAHESTDLTEQFHRAVYGDYP